MIHKKPTPSLLDMLAADRNLFRLTLTPAENSARFPFASTPAAGPLAHVVDAVLQCGACSIEPLTLLVQKDDYNILSDGMNGISNSLVDRLWQACRRHHLEGKNSGLLLDLGNTNGFRPHQPLFYCREKQLFFHPACPHCSGPLKLCTDDGLLATFGLPAYTTSLQRYLYCPDCVQDRSRAVFYTKEYYGNQPARVLDGKALVSSWKALAQNQEHSEFICNGCDLAEKCFQAGGRADFNLVPFSFYPFYLLAFRGLHLNMKDFISLVADGGLGKAEKDLPSAGRKARIQVMEKVLDGRRLFLATGGNHRWLEILHLKLCLLAEMVRQINTAGNILPEGSSPWSIESFWIRLQPVAGKLPALWQMEVFLVDMVSKTLIHPATRAQMRLHRLQFLSAAWFYILLANSSQGVDQIMAALENLPAYDKNFDGPIFDPSNPDQWPKEFHPAQLLWQPQPMQPDDTGLSLWSQALELGLDLLKTAMGQEKDNLEDGLEARIDALVRETGQALLETAPSGDRPAQPTAENNDLQLASVIAGIRQRWSASIQPQGPDQDGDWAETVVLTPAAENRPSEPDPSVGRDRGKTVVQETYSKPGTRSGDDLEKTVVLASPGPENDNRPDDLEKTVVLNKTGAPDTAADLEKTMIAGGSKAKATVPPPPGDMDLEKTVVLGKTQVPVENPEPSGRPKPEPQSPDDDLEETLVLKPRRSKDGK